MVPSETQKNSFKNIFENEVTEPELDDDVKQRRIYNPKCEKYWIDSKLQ